MQQIVCIFANKKNAKANLHVVVLMQHNCQSSLVNNHLFNSAGLEKKKFQSLNDALFLLNFGEQQSKENKEFNVCLFCINNFPWQREMKENLLDHSAKNV